MDNTPQQPQPTPPMPQTPSTPEQPPVPPVEPSVIPPTQPPTDTLQPTPQAAPTEQPQPAASNYWQQSDEPQAPIAPEVQFDDPVAAPSADETLTKEDPVNWEAQEYIHLEKGWLWFTSFIVIVLAIVALDVLFLHTWTVSLLAVVIAIAIIVYSRRAPRTLHYALSPDQGLYVGEKLYHFSEFKAFGLIHDGPHLSIMLIPVKRFSPGVSVYFPEEAGEQIVDILGKRLPMENLKLDAIDVATRWLRL